MARNVAAKVTGPPLVNPPQNGRQDLPELRWSDAAGPRGSSAQDHGKPEFNASGLATLDAASAPLGPPQAAPNEPSRPATGA